MSETSGNHALSPARKVDLEPRYLIRASSVAGAETEEGGPKGTPCDGTSSAAEGPMGHPLSEAPYREDPRSFPFRESDGPRQRKDTEPGRPDPRSAHREAKNESDNHAGYCVSSYPIQNRRHLTRSPFFTDLSTRRAR